MGVFRRGGSRGGVRRLRWVLLQCSGGDYHHCSGKSVRTAEHKADMAMGNERQDPGIFEGEIPNTSRTKLLLAVVPPKDGETRIHEQMLQRMDIIHAARGKGRNNCSGRKNDTFNEKDEEV